MPSHCQCMRCIIVLFMFILDLGIWKTRLSAIQIVCPSDAHRIQVWRHPSKSFFWSRCWQEAHRLTSILWCHCCASRVRLWLSQETVCCLYFTIRPVLSSLYRDVASIKQDRWNADCYCKDFLPMGEMITSLSTKGELLTIKQHTFCPARRSISDPSQIAVDSAHHRYLWRLRFFHTQTICRHQWCTRTKGGRCWFGNGNSRYLDLTTLNCWDYTSASKLHCSCCHDPSDIRIHNTHLKAGGYVWSLWLCFTGTEVAKEAADIVIMDDNFNSIVKSVLWGRSVFANLRKFLQFQLTINGVALVVAFVAAVTNGQTPLNVIQLLWVNLIMDSLAALGMPPEFYLY